MQREGIIKAVNAGLAGVRILNLVGLRHKE
jgi:hypothetical protein